MNNELIDLLRKHEDIRVYPTSKTIEDYRTDIQDVTNRIVHGVISKLIRQGWTCVFNNGGIYTHWSMQYAGEGFKHTTLGISRFAIAVMLDERLPQLWKILDYGSHEDMMDVVSVSDEYTFDARHIDYDICQRYINGKLIDGEEVNNGWDSKLDLSISRALHDEADSIIRSVENGQMYFVGDADWAKIIATRNNEWVGNQYVKVVDSKPVWIEGEFWTVFRAFPTQ